MLSSTIEDSGSSSPRWLSSYSMQGCAEESGWYSISEQRRKDDITDGDVDPLPQHTVCRMHAAHVAKNQVHSGQSQAVPRLWQL